MTVAVETRPYTASLACVPPGRAFKHQRFCDEGARRKLVRRFHCLPTVASQLPRRLPSGYTWEMYRAICPTCLTNALDPDVHGRITQLVPSVLSLDGLFWCAPCRHLAPIQIRLRDQGAAQAVIEFQDDGAWSQENVTEVDELNPEPELTLAERGYVRVGVLILRILSRLRTNKSRKTEDHNEG